MKILGQGGMGSVYRAVDENLGVDVAVKENLFTTDEYARQFRLAVGLLFSALPFFALIKVLASRSAFFARIEEAISPEHAEPQGTRFAPHWMLLIGMIAVALLIISVVINIIRSLF